jgi:tRNA nucleotidyltransferase (CCA-adding enzyme)
VKSLDIPDEIIKLAKVLENAGFKPYLVGGCVRDLLMDKTPKDWDIATDAVPDEIIDLFPKTFYTNKFGTVTVVENENGPIKNVEITPFRMESKYTDKRHPDTVKFSKNLEDDLSRRDFKMNAIAYDISKGQIIDPYKGLKDIKDKIISAVGNAGDRLNEDALRIMRAVRLSVELDFTCNKDLYDAISKNGKNIKDISIERIRDEFCKIINSKVPSKGIQILHDLGILKYIIPELEEGLGVDQNQAHSFDVWEHSLKTLQHGANKKWSFHVRLAALLHDVAKPRTKGWNEKKKDNTFYGHDVVGARVTEKILKRMKFSRETINIVTKLVRYHLFFSDIDKITMSAVRRIVRNVGRDNVWDLMKLRACDRIGTGRPKESPYRLRKYESMVEEALRDPISVGMLKINGEIIMKTSNIKPGPVVGQVLHALLEEVIDNPKLNDEKLLEKRAVELIALPKKELESLGNLGKEKQKKTEDKIVGEIRKKHWVK